MRRQSFRSSLERTVFWGDAWTFAAMVTTWRRAVLFHVGTAATWNARSPTVFRWRLNVCFDSSFRTLGGSELQAFGPPTAKDLSAKRRCSWHHVVLASRGAESRVMTTPTELCDVGWRSTVIDVKRQCRAYRVWNEYGYRLATNTIVRVYFKRGVQPKCGVKNEKCGVQDWEMWSPK